MSEKTISVRYFAVLREARGIDRETLSTSAPDANALYRELTERHRFTLDPVLVKAAVNGAFVSSDTILAEGDEVVFIPPVAGG